MEKLKISQTALTQALGHMRKLTDKNARLYKQIAVGAAVIALVLVYFFWPLSFIAAGVAFYAFTASRKNRSGKPLKMAKAVLLKKERWSQTDNNEKPPKQHHLYYFAIRYQQEADLTENGLQNHRTTAQTATCRVPSAFYERYNPNDELVFIESPAEDLIAYLWGDELVLLTNQHTLSNGTLYGTSASIALNASGYPPLRHSKTAEFMTNSTF